MAKIKIQFTEEEFQTIKDLASRGFTISQIAKALGISRATLNRRLSENLELRQLIHASRYNAHLEIANVAFEMAKSGKYPAMTLFWLRSRADWGQMSLEAQEESENNSFSSDDPFS